MSSHAHNQRSIRAPRESWKRHYPEKARDGTLLCFYVYILVIDNIMNKSLFMQVEIAKNLLLFVETTTILFI